MGLDRVVVDPEVGLGERVHRELPGPGVASRGQSRRECPIGEHTLERRSELFRVAGGHQKRVAVGDRDVAVPGRSLATTGVPAAIASSRTTPNDSPRNDGAQNTSAPCIREAFSASVSRPSHSTRMSPAKRAFSSAVSDPSLPTHRRRVRRQARHCFEQHVEALPRFMTPDEEDRRTVGRRGRSLRVEIGLDAVVEQAVLAPECLVRKLARASSDTAHRSVRRLATQRVSGMSHRYAALSPAAWNVPTIGLFEKSAAVTVAPGASGS